MLIKSISYSEYGGEPRFWQAEEIPLGLFNLVVGRNAVGKSRLLNVVNGLAQLVSGRRGPMTTGKYSADFSSGDTEYSYDIEFKNNTVQFEHLREREKGGRFRDLLRREDDGYGRIRIKTGKTSKLIDFECPVSQIGVFSRRDKINHPFLADFVEWGLSSYHFQFGRGELKEFVVLDSGAKAEYDPLDTSRFSNTFQKGMEKFGNQFKDILISDLDRVGYKIDNISIDEPFGVNIQQSGPGRVGVVSVKEADIKCSVGSHHLSAGMLRALSLVIQINYRAMAHDPSLFIIDDVGEGLDFERTCSLVELLVEKAQGSDIQMLMSSNDRFVMNNIPLKYWILLDRLGSDVRAMTYSTHRREFEEFRFTGLSNFDFFTQNFTQRTND